MKFSLNFLKEFLDVNVSAKELAKLLTMAGMEVEQLERIGRDWVFDVEVTTNRYDWLSILGIAREAAVVLGRKIKITYPVFVKESSLKERNIIIEKNQDCPYYIGRIIKNVRAGSQVNWLKERVMNCGITSVDAIVDVTNYCMLKWGNPLHVFDNDKIEGNVYVRRARSQEQFMGIDGKQRCLGKNNLVIADDKKIIALAGIMGAKNTEVDNNTKNIFLEGAVFSPLTVRRSRRAIGLDTESSYRFERRVSGVFLEYASLEAATLIRKLSGGVSGGCRKAGHKPKEQCKRIVISFCDLDSYLGTAIPKMDVKKILTNLGFSIHNTAKDKITVLAPILRFDVKREIDVYEEIARVYGYDKISPQIPFLTACSNTNLLKFSKHNNYNFKNQVRKYIALLGFREIITHSIENQKELRDLDDKEVVLIVNPLRKQEDSMRTTLLSGMAKAMRHNLNRSVSFLRFFEVANIYYKEAKGFCEIPVLSLGISGKLEGFFYLKGAIEELFNYVNPVRCLLSNGVKAAGLSFEEKSVKNFTNSLAITVNNKMVGFLGKLDRKKKENLGLKENVYFAQVNLSLIEDKSGENKYKPFSIYPAVYRDVSISLSKGVKFKTIEKIINEECRYLSNLRILDTYKGKDVPSDVSVFTLRVFYQSPKKTLTSSEVDSIHERIRNRLSQQEGIKLR
ncbi:MAG: phenylalanine--tRNA ligase subunit beta [Omnitrophica bacterium]|nr:phenylalanine--tRNA ligase subunit beta [Candidatus Omnitrophota bacterium]